jgi:hypothetical protein
LRATGAVEGAIGGPYRGPRSGGRRDRRRDERAAKVGASGAADASLHERRMIPSRASTAKAKPAAAHSQSMVVIGCPTVLSCRRHNLSAGFLQAVHATAS